MKNEIPKYNDDTEYFIANLTKSDSKKILPLIKKYIENKEVADIGCGTGFASRFMAEWYGTKIIMLDVEDNRCPSNKNFPYLNSTETTLPLADNSIDVSYIQYVLHHLNVNPVTLLKEAYRISKLNLILIEECDAKSKEINKFIEKDIEMNKILHPKSSYPIMKFFNEETLDSFIKDSKWIIDKKFILSNDNYLQVNIYILKK
ncbi:MAG: class I SAM-dependent methyltransferase [Candidatus Pacebacteria bacterium]|nr:class I SAM-dependent methyltransferase [Candidatus Paceibacterota bacterium]